jgi:hypothetical protein
MDLLKEDFLREIKSDDTEYVTDRTILLTGHYSTYKNVKLYVTRYLAPGQYSFAENEDGVMKEYGFVK